MLAWSKRVAATMVVRRCIDDGDGEGRGGEREIYSKYMVVPTR